MFEKVLNTVNHLVVNGSLPRYGKKWVNDIRVILFLLCSSTELKFIGKFYGLSRYTTADVKITWKFHIRTPFTF